MYGVDEVPFANVSGINFAALGLSRALSGAASLTAVLLVPWRVGFTCVSTVGGA